MTRACDAIGCQTSVKPGRFMCQNHWYTVNLELRRVITFRYSSGLKDRAFLSDLIYLQACKDAVDQVAAAERKTGTNPYQRLIALAQQRRKVA